MKKIIFVFLLFFLSLSLSACSPAEIATESPESQSEIIEPSEESTIAATDINTDEIGTNADNFSVEIYELPRTSWAVNDLNDSVIFLIRALTDFNQYDEVLDMYNHFSEAEAGGEVWNHICWYGSLDGYSEQVIEICDKAVFLEPEVGAYRDSRGLAQALNGDTNSAIEDFGFFIIWFDTLSDVEKEIYGYSDDMVSRRRDWISALQEGISPFDDQEIAHLQLEGNLSALFNKIYVYSILDSLLTYQYYGFAADIFLQNLDLFESASDVELAWMFHNLCIKGSLYGDAEKMISICNKSIAYANIDGVFYDSRGFARAMTGDVDEALSDFNNYLEGIELLEPDQVNQYYQGSNIPIEVVLRWIEVLDNYEYPFTENDFLMLFELTGDF